MFSWDAPCILPSTLAQTWQSLGSQIVNASRSRFWDAFAEDAWLSSLLCLYNHTRALRAKEAQSSPKKRWRVALVGGTPEHASGPAGRAFANNLGRGPLSCKLVVPWEKLSQGGLLAGAEVSSAQATQKICAFGQSPDLGCIVPYAIGHVWALQADGR